MPESIPSMTAANNLALTMRAAVAPKTILDVGANVSQMTKLLLLFWPNARVLSFEPNTALKPAGKVYNIALSDSDETVKFYIPADSTWATVVKSKVSAYETKIVQVPSCRFDSLLQKGEISRDELLHPIFLKVDTEGCEYKTLKGFGEFLSQIDYLLLEVTNPHDATNDSLKIFQLLSECGFNSSKILYAGHNGSAMPDYLDVLFWKESLGPP
jgi:FkbM family methyltransferase